MHFMIKKKLLLTVENKHSIVGTLFLVLQDRKISTVAIVERPCALYHTTRVTGAASNLHAFFITPEIK